MLTLLKTKKLTVVIFTILCGIMPIVYAQSSPNDVLINEDISTDDDLSASNESESSVDFPAGNNLQSFIGELNSVIQEHSVEFFTGNRLLILDSSISEITTVSTSVEIQDNVLAQQFQFNEQQVSAQEENSVIQHIRALLPSLPSNFNHEDSNQFTFFRADIVLLYTSNSNSEIESVQLGIGSSRIRIHGVEVVSEQNQQIFPGTPLLLWPSQEFNETTTESRILFSFEFDSSQNLVEVSRYLYDFFGNIYELQQETPNDSRIFFALDDAEKGSREIVTDGEYSLISLRNFDDQGRLRYSTQGTDSSELESNIRISYLNDGGREETEQFGTGEEEQRRYTEDNKLLAVLRRSQQGLIEERNFSYTSNGDILVEDYSGPLGSMYTEYEYVDDELKTVTTQRDELLHRTLEIDGAMSVETRFLRGEPVLRIYLENDIRVREEEILNGQVIRTRDYRASEDINEPDDI